MNIPASPLSSQGPCGPCSKSNAPQHHVCVKSQNCKKSLVEYGNYCRAQRPLTHEHSAGSVHDQVVGEHRAASGKRGLQSGHSRGSLARPRRALCGWCYGRITRHVRCHALLGCGLHLVRVNVTGLGLGAGSELGIGSRLGLGLGIGLRL